MVLVVVEGLSRPRGSPVSGIVARAHAPRSHQGSQRPGRVSVILITHRLQDLFVVCDRIIVTYEGRNVAERPIGQTSIEETVDLIVGRKFRSVIRLVNEFFVAREGILAFIVTLASLSAIRGFALYLTKRYSIL
jgi:ribose/xylose/arabinose/galactoside ABC-type transport system permease subunit